MARFAAEHEYNRKNPRMGPLAAAAAAAVAAAAAAAAAGGGSGRAAAAAGVATAVGGAAAPATDGGGDGGGCGGGDVDQNVSPIQISKPELWILCRWSHSLLVGGQH